MTDIAESFIADSEGLRRAALRGAVPSEVRGRRSVRGGARDHAEGRGRDAPSGRSLIFNVTSGGFSVVLDKPIDGGVAAYEDGFTLLELTRKYYRGEGNTPETWGYQGDNMHLPVRDLAAAVPFYESVLGFRVLSRSDTPHNSAVLARDEVQIGLAENGGDPTQDGCAFHVKDL